ncbi:TadE/TadG family type IV pilus assembly protein [Sphingobium bisphenolivorans]|uniref:TadE/TadG family type IV pilus assembly protein n=1 Tax=Sphingobium bisphenolivorans TaxID=1335760 RepID=UPI0003B45ED4|nr:TadE/TadG family type IV pilus assembly protein [Sphingobium bisphenolivorans]
MGDRFRRALFILMRLYHNQAGNTLAIVAAAMIPLVGMVGAGVDFSRTYLVKARMQQACDAGALAGRRSMSGTVLTSADKAEALKYFNYNFPNQLMGAAAMSTTDSNALNRVTTELENGQLRMKATTAVPTTLLKVVGINEMRVNAECLGEEYYVNTDLMLVLDTTGSMNCYLTDALSCSQETEKPTSGTKKSKMLEMREALKTLYSNLRPAQVALEAKNLRMRIGFLQFSSTVNVGKLIRQVNPAYVRSTYAYRNSSGSLKSATDWNAYSSNWLDISWEGCIEERGTSTALTATTTSIPSDAWDLDIAKIPDSDTTRWAPYDYQATSGSTRISEESMGSVTSSNYYKAACPKPAVALQKWDSTTAFNTQVDKIVQGDGPTYHDLGIIWGLRMIANNGIFGGNNPDKFNNVKVRRTIVFMTDGYMQPFRNAYSAYGVAQYAGRTASTGTSDASLEDIHKQRFKLMCAKAKSDPYYVDVWVIAVLSGQAMDAEISSCASNSSQAIAVSNSTDLANAFKRISDKVGNLRIGA